MISKKTIKAKKLRIIDQIDQALYLQDKPSSGYNYIVDSLSVSQLQAIKEEVFNDLWYYENSETNFTMHK